MCLALFKKLFRRSTPPTPPPRFPSPPESPEYKTISTGHGGPNMPKKQPCPRGHGLKKRARKTMGGAFYFCNVCPVEFVVVHP